MPRLFRTWLLPVLLVCAVQVPAAAEVTDRFVRTVAVAPGTPISLHVTVGKVQITGWDRAEVAIEIVRRAPDAARLARIPVQIDQPEGRLTVRAVQNDAGRDALLRTDVVMRVPASANLREVVVFEGQIDISGLRGAYAARLERGDIVAKDVSGTIRLETGMGNIRLESATLSSDGSIRLRTFNGDVTLGLAQKPQDARILALSMGGTVSSDIPLTRQDRWGARFGETSIGAGEPVISIDVVNGNVVLRLGN